MSTTKNLGLFKHDNPETNTTDIFNIDKTLNQNWDKTDEAFGKDRYRLDLLEASNTIYNFKGKVDTLANLQLKTKTEGDVWYCIENSTYYTYTGTDWIPVNLNLKLGVIDELKAKTIKCLQEVETPTPVSGTSIDLNDSAEAKITELKISGNSEQETRSGKNLLNFNGFATKEISGVTITNNNDGSITLNGTATATISIRLSNQMNKTLTAGNYYFSSNSKGSVSGAFTTFMFGNNDAEDIKFATITEENKGFSTSIDYKKYWLWLYINSGITFTNYIMKPQLEAGTVKTDWELYGASPSPDYPSEVESCGDNINIFDGDNANKFKAFFDSNKTEITSSGESMCTYIKITGGKVYTITKKAGTRFNVCTTETIPKVGTSIIDNANNVSSSNIQTNATKIVIKTSFTAQYLVIWYYGGTDTVNEEEMINSIKIVEGTETGGYSPYGQGCINEVICNKNICNFGSIQNSNIGLTNNLDKNVWKISGTSNANGYITAFGRTSLGKFKAGTYSFSWKYSGTLTYASGGDTSISLFNKSLSKIIMDKALNTENKYSKFILTEDTEIALGFWNIGSGNVYSLEIECQLELSETNTEIVEHQSQTYTIPTQQPFRAVGDVRDTFIKKNNKWFERHWIPRYIFTGNEEWKFEIVNGTNSRFTCEKMPNLGYTVKTNVLSLCNAYSRKKEEDYYTYNNAFILRYVNDVNRIDIIDNRFDNIDDFKSFLQEQYNAGTPVYIDYILETPLDIECTEEQSTILFDIEQNAKTYDKVTHMYSTDNVSPVIDVTYKKDIETLFANTLIEEVG